LPEDRAEIMQFAAAVALAAVNVALSLAWCGAHPSDRGPWWICGPFIVTFGAALLAWRMSAVLPVPWAGARRYGSPPRRVHLSWRTAFRILVAVPVLVIACHLYWSLSPHFDIGWVLYVVIAVAAVAVVAHVARRRRRETVLLRDGDVALGVVDSRSNIGEGPDRIAYRFTTAHAETISGRGRDVGYGVIAGSRVPVFYDERDPTQHIIACACWFEAE